MNRDILCRPFPPEQVRHRPGQNGKTLTYIDVAAVIARLNEAVDVWHFEVLKHEIFDEEVVVLGKLTADGIIKMAFGSSAITREAGGRAVSVGDDLKASSSDALKKAASLLGCALELYGGAAPASPPRPGPKPGPRPETGASPPPPAPADRLTSRQAGAVHAAARRRNISRDHLAALLQQRTGKDRVELLSRREASDLITELTAANGHG